MAVANIVCNTRGRNKARPLVLQTGDEDPEIGNSGGGTLEGGMLLSVPLDEGAV